MKLLILITLLLFHVDGRSQNDTSINKWINATLNVLCYSKKDQDVLLSLDSLIESHKIDSNTYSYYVYQTVLSGSRGTALWFTFKNHNFLLTARHVLEDTTIGPGNCYNQIHIIENDTTHLVDLSQSEFGAHRSIISEIGMPSDVLFVNNSKLFKFSSKFEDIAIVNLDSSYYWLGLYKFLKLSGYQPINIQDIDTLFKVKNNSPVVAIGYPEESTFKIKDAKELPIKYALFTTPILTIPIITKGLIVDLGKSSVSFEVNIFTYHGFSGGPVINAQNNLIGITHGYTTELKHTSKKAYLQFHGEFRKLTGLMPLTNRVLNDVQSQEMQSEHFQIQF